MSDEELIKSHSEVMSEHPYWIILLSRFLWVNKLSPFDMSRFLGTKHALYFITSYVDNDYMPNGTIKEEHYDHMIEYMFQIFQRDGTTEYAPMAIFT